MKKIVALVLSLVMVLGLATTAFGAITLWDENNETALCDLYDGEYNTKLNAQDVPVAVTYDPGNALKLNKDGSVKTPGVIAHYTMSYSFQMIVDKAVNSNTATGYNDARIEESVASAVDAMGLPAIYDYEFEPTGEARDVLVTVYADVPFLFVQSANVPADADAGEYFFVKKHSALVPQNYQWQPAQSAADPYVILKAVDAVTYYGEATEFTAWSDDCEAYAEPLNADDVDYYTVTKGVLPLAAGLAAYKIPAFEDAYEGDEFNVLVGDEVVTLNADDYFWVSATKHTWVASKWDADKAPTEYTCANCKTVGTVINASINAPAGAKIDKVGQTLIAYTMGAKAPAAGDKVESAQTFDAGIAMYVGMSVMAAAGSAVVLKKKD